MLVRVEQEERLAAFEELRALARWSGWGAVPELFDKARSEWRAQREQLLALIGGDGFAAARRSTINAHYTHPLIAEAIWDLAAELGFRGGRVLEPGCGAGVFIGLAPDGPELTGIELDDTSARIAQTLYPEARILARSFTAPSRTPDGSFDLVVGNVPFGSVKLHDPRHNVGGHSIHNHFIIKSLALTRPGGLVVVLTSRYTLDAGNPAARREMVELADLVGALRLPSGAHRRVAGTEAITDLLVFRRRAPGAAPADEDWIRTQQVDVDGGEVRISSYFAQRPGQVLGAPKLARGLYDAAELVVEQLADVPALAGLIRSWGRSFASHEPPPASVDVAAATVAPAVETAAEELWDGHLLALATGGFAEVRDGVREPVAVPRTAIAELRHLLGLRDRARELLDAEAATLEDTPAIDELRRGLREAYESYRARYGAINRFSLRRTGRIDPRSGEEHQARITPAAIRILRRDPFAALVLSLELFDETTQEATASGILSQRQVAPRAPILGADTAEDALALCLDAHGEVRLDEVARLLGVSASDARGQLGELVYDDPQVHRLVPAAEYLSGNVRQKLATASEMLVSRPELSVNVAALGRVLPADLGADEVEPRLGAAWIDADTHREFLAEILQDNSIRVEHPGAAVWAVRGNTHSVLARSEWGTRRMPAPQLAKAVLEQRPVQVTDELADGRRVINPVETAAAEEKALALQERFGEWCWEQPDRARRLLGEYNRLFNSIVLRDYGVEAQRLSLPGLAGGFTPLDHQRVAVARMLAEPAVGLFHHVGAGKTAEMIIGASELRRLGMIRKPAVVVPNHMLEQFTREWLQLYPQARVLAASSADLAGERRRRFVARAASNDWDAVLMTRSAFERIPVSHGTQQQYEQREIAQLREMLSAARGGEGLTVKRLERIVLAAEERLAAKLDGEKDTGVCFEQTGIDYLVIDEAHAYKNLATVSNIRDAAIDGSRRASDLHMKLSYLRARHGRRVITMATATPIANSVTEAHVMQRYLRPDLLAAAGVEQFDAWAATFGQTVTEIEMAPTGGGNYRMNTRFARFQNVPEMLRMWHVFADVKTAEDLNLPTPRLRQRGDGERAAETIVIPAGREIREYLAQLAERAEQVRDRSVTPEEDNMLKISTDGRKAALDMRLVSGETVAGLCKLDLAAEKIVELWEASRQNSYIDAGTGEPSPVRGALQLVFCDLGTPSAGGWSAYEELRALLAARGIPADTVRFIHDARSDQEKGRLFAACRAGHVAVLVGSTEKMGVGTNIQARALALHHLDCPWRPADIEQREGRILRQGNQNPEIGIYRYVVEGSFDAYSWQTVERKAKFISQIIRGRLGLRAIEDIGDSALSFAEVKALASGDALILDHARAAAELTRLQRLERAWRRNQDLLRDTHLSATERHKSRTRELDQIGEALARRTSTRGDSFEITIAGRTVTDRKVAAELLGSWASRAEPGESEPVAVFGGQSIVGVIRVDHQAGTREATFCLDGLPAEPARLTLRHLRESPLSLIRQLEHRVADLDDLRGRVESARAAADAEAERSREALTRPFKHVEELRGASARIEEIRAAMQERQRRDERQQSTSRDRGPTALASTRRTGALSARL